MTSINVLGDRVVCPTCDRVGDADLFLDRSGTLHCGQCAPRRRRRGSVVVPLGCGRASAVPIAQRPGSREAL